jgi:hypothetical protein
VVDKPRKFRRVHEDAAGVDSDNPSAAGHGLDLVVGQVPEMVAEGPAIGVRRDDRGLGELDDVPEAGVIEVGDVNDDSQFLGFLQNRRRRPSAPSRRISDGKSAVGQVGRRAWSAQHRSRLVENAEKLDVRPRARPLPSQDEADFPASFAL